MKQSAQQLLLLAFIADVTLTSCTDNRIGVNYSVAESRAAQDASVVWSRDITRWTGDSIYPLAIAATAKSIILFHRRPSTLALFRLDDGSLQSLIAERMLEEADLLNPIALIRADETSVWLLDATTRGIVSFGSSGNAVSHTVLRTDTEPFSACMSTDSTVLVVSRESFDVVREFSLSDGRQLRSIPPWANDSTSSFSLGRQAFFSVGAPAISCALSRVFGDGFVSFESGTIHSIHEYIESFKPPDDTVKIENSGTTVTTSRSLKNVSLAALSTATASFGTAVLFAGETRLAGRLIDIYDKQGRYTHTITLPFEGRLIAADSSRVYVLSTQQQRWQLSAVAISPHLRTRP